MAQNNINVPSSGFGGLTRYNEEYDSILNLKPTHIIVFVIAIVAFRFLLGAILG